MAKIVRYWKLAQVYEEEPPQKRSVLSPRKHVQKMRTSKSGSKEIIAIRILLIICSCLFAAYAKSGALISGDFGTVNAPNKKEYAEIELKTGELILAKRLEEEHDTLYALLMDYQSKPIPFETIAKITIRDTPETTAENKNNRVLLFAILLAFLAVGVWEAANIIY